MYGKGSNLRNTCKQLPGNSSSFGSKLPLQTGFDLSHQYNTRDQVGVFPDWRKNIAIIHERNLIRNKMSGIHYKKEQAFVIANALENELFIEASSQEEYMNENTLIERMDSKLKKLTETKCREQADSYTIYTSKTLPPSGLPQPAFQKVYINKSPNFSVSAWVSNLEARSKSINYHSPQQQPDNCENYHQMLEHKTLKQPEYFTRSLNVDKQFTLRSSAADLLDLDGSANMNSGSSSIVSDTQRILLLYFYCNNLKDFSRDLVTKHLHSTVCGEGTCTCQQYRKLLLHFDDCQDDNCQICYSWKLRGTNIQNSVIKDYVVRKNVSSSSSEHMLSPAVKRRKIESAFDVSLIDSASWDMSTHKLAQHYSYEALSNFQQQPESSLLFNYSNVSECNFKQFPMPDSISNTEIKNNVIDDAFGNISKDETILSKDLDTDHMSEEPDPKINDGKVSRNLEETVTRSHSVVYALKDLMSANIEEIVPISDHVKDIRNLEQGKEDHVKDISNLEQGKEAESPNPTVNTVSLTDFFTCDQIMEHIASLRKQFNQSAKIEEQGVDVYKCQLCEIGTLPFAPVPIYCFCCGIRIKRNSYYYYRREEDDTQPCFCTVCYRNSRGGNITFNGTSVSKTDLYKKTNNGEFEEAWVECNKCKSWQHQICALYNDKRDLDNSVEYTCPICRLKEIENGMHVPLPKNAMFGAKDLPSTMLSDHIERRLFKRLMQESEDWAKVEGNKNLDEVLLAENLSVRVVLSVEKQLKVKKQFLDIFVEENYPAEFPYTSKVILLFQQIEGVDVCLFAMYVQEFGSECGNPNKRSVYISYLDSVKYFRPQRATMNGEALRTFVYHEILIGYLDFCKKRGFKTCYIWACPPIKGEDYILYCHPDTQKTPKNDKLRHWYLSMLRKAAEENIVVGLTNIYDNFFVSTRNWNSKVTAAHLPYFDGDFWSGAAMDKARIIDQECGGDYEKMKKLMTKRTLKTMGHVNPSKGTAKDILVMQKLGQTILPFKEDFIVVQLQYVCMHCHEVIMSGKRWFCTATECKTFQECQRCHTANSHTSRNGEKHTLRQVFMDDILCDTKENDVILDNGLFDTRHNLLSFCQRNSLQFDSLRRAKYSSMMILYFLKNPNLLNVGTICRVCNKQNVYQCHWKCQNCPEFTVCSACYNKKGANCHAHTLTQTFSTALSPSGNQELNQNSALIQELQDVIKHASQCHSTKTQPCTYPHCLQLKKLFSHASRCTIRVSGGCQYCKKVWVALSVHSRNCRDSGCQIPRCMDLKKHAEWIATQSESRRRAAVLEATANSHPH